MTVRVIQFCKAAAKRSLLATRHYARMLRRQSFPGVAVLCYHGVRDDSVPPERVTLHRFHLTAAAFESHCRLLRETCHPIALAQWRRAMAGGPPLPPRPTLITFDDGYRSVLHSAAPILKAYQMPAVIFVSSHFVETRSLFWWDALARSHGEEEVKRAKRLRFGPWLERVKELHRPCDERDPNAPLTPDEVGDLSRMPGIEIGGHTARHAILANLDRNRQLDEIRENKNRLEQWTGRPVHSFAYPNGQPGIDYTSETIQILKELSFDAAFTTGHGFADDSRPLERRRFVMLSGMSAAELAHCLCYSWR